MTIETAEEREGPAGAAGPAPARLGRTVAWLAKQVELGLCDVDLSLPQYRVLALLDGGSSLSSALAERLAVRPPSVTAVVDGLVTRGLVDRVAVADDRRRVALVLTPCGRRVLDEADRAAEGRLRAIAGSLGPAGSACAHDDLGRWHEALIAHRRARMPGR